MRKTLILTIAALAGLLLVWLIVVRAPDSRTTAPAKALVQAPPAARSVAASAPVVETVPPKPTEVPTAPAASTAPPRAETVEPPATTEPPPDSATSSDPGADANAEDATPADSDATDDEDSGPEGIDTGRAADLMAEMIAKLETPDDEHRLPNGMTDLLKQFDQESADAEWAEAMEQQIEAKLGEWMGRLPEEAQSHMALLTVQCRATLCQVLAADNDPDSADARAEAGQEWQQALNGLTSLGFRMRRRTSTIAKATRST